MQRFFFRVVECGGKVLEDPDGMTLADAEEARSQAKEDARELMAADVKAGELCLGCHIEVDDEDGVRVMDVPFREAIRVSGF